MTSTVQVTAHCSADKEVVCFIGDDTVVLQDGQSVTNHIYDKRIATAYERVKDAEPTFGEKAVGLGFTPSGDSQVTQCKRHYARIIDLMNDARNSATADPETKRMLSIAITEAQTSQMWAVKALTWN